jgi:hypothetical protein
MLTAFKFRRSLLDKKDRFQMYMRSTHFTENIALKMELD